MKIKIFDDKMSVRGGFSRIIEHEQENCLYGEVVTPHGIVLIFSQGGYNSFYYTRLEFFKKGILYMRNIDGKRYSSRGLVTLSKRFAKEICENKR